MSPKIRNRIIIVGGIIVVLAIVLAVIFRPDPTKVTVEILVSPKDSTFTIDGQPAKTGKITLTKAKHTLKATHQYFADATKEIDGATIDPKQTVYVLPKPNTPEAQQWLRDHPDDAILRDKGVAIDVTATQDMLYTKYPIVANLPHQTLDYTIAYTVEDDKSVSFQVTVYTPSPTPQNQAMVQEIAATGKKEAIDYFKTQGVDPAKEKVTYVTDSGQPIQ